MANGTSTQEGIAYLDMQANVGITKHIGGRAATDQLLSWCHADKAHEVLCVGCGIGVSTAYIAKKLPCHVVGVDISDKMIEWARLRAKREGVESKIELGTADIQDLPYEANRFDVVIVESVIAFVPNRARAIAECVRVTRPGGSVGLNETFFAESLSRESVELLGQALGGPGLLTLKMWQSLWEASGLQQCAMQTYSIDARQEVQDRIHWIGVRWSLEAMGRLFRLYLTQPNARASIREQYGSTSDLLPKMKYVLFAGEKRA